TAPSILEELKNPLIREALSHAVKSESIMVRAPGEDFRRKALDTAGFLGETRLSEADIDVIALALEYGAQMVSDDYAVQNVCAHLEIPYAASFHEGITEKRRYLHACTGCGRIANASEKSCVVCGADVKRKIK
ncbi:MAG TPA: hypothetical protein ENN13_02380, partial [Candidatus Altiarchaeales archaeon]|nr:hypothetical protein [Candidatus Altiarchaeales archaeon]